MSSIFCTFLCTFYALFVSIENLPVLPSSSASESDNQVPDHVVNFLRKYGYLSSDIFDSNLANSQRKLNFLIHDAIKKYQSFHLLPTSGIVDNSTLDLMNKPRCGFPDFPTNAHHRAKRYSIFGSKWPKLTISFRIEEYPRDLPWDIFRREVLWAFQTWSKNSKLEFIEVSHGDADILISFPPRFHGDYNFDGLGEDIGHAFAPGPGKGGDVHLDGDEKWVATKRERDRIKGVLPVYGALLHELGHSLGLFHSSDRNAIMYERLVKYWLLDEDLPQDDKDGIQFLYGSRGDSTPADRTKPYTYPTVSWPDPDQTPKSADHSAPETCDTNFDAAAYIRQETFFFTRRHFWRLSPERELRRNYSAATETFWFGLPERFKKIDAVYERPSDGYIMFFIGKEYLLFSANNATRGYPRPLTYLGLPPSLEKIDAAFVFGAQQSVYFFTGDKYWKFDEKTNRVEISYPRNLSVWKGIPGNIDAVLSYPKEDIAYFFKGKFFWEFDGRNMAVKSKIPQSSVHFWFKNSCKDTPVPPYDGFAHHSSPNTVLLILLIILVSMLSSKFD
ncbi:stromelysin-2-like [Brevipalpus obovatus]|uniref:stromelysin-2-like n=1 Tax=Brevipalpus obovatus TaxID=246614 RepID=UPI003D9DC52E